MNKAIRLFPVVLTAVILSTLVVLPVSADDDENKKLPMDKVSERGLSIMVLGSGGPVATPKRASAGYMIFVDKQPRILMDAGGGVQKRIGDAGINIANLGTVLLSHLHIDHMGALSPTLKMLFFHNRAIGQQRDDRIHFYGPDSDVGAFSHTDEYINGLYSEQGGLERYLHGFAGIIAGSTFSYMAHSIASSELIPDPQLIVDDADGLKVYAIGVNHGPVPSLGFRVEYDGKSIVYSGDTTSAGPNMMILSKNADMLIYDTAIMDDTPAPFINLHTTPSRIGEVASAANVDQLVLSHITPMTEPNMPMVKHLVRAQGYRGKIKVARDLKVYNLSED